MLAENVNLPKGWTWSCVKDIGEVVTGTTPSKSKPQYYGIDYPFFKPADLNAGYYTRESKDGLSNEGIKEARLLPARSVLVTCIGTVGKTGLIRTEGASNQQVNAVIPNLCVIPEYVYYYCISTDFQKNLIVNASATILAIINKRKFEVLPFLLPPLPEQRRIVSKIDELFSDLEVGVSSLQKAKAELARYRQSVLTHAFSGKLSAKWREAHKDVLEPASVILERIRAERAKSAKTRRNETTATDAADLPGLPDGWEWTTVGDVSVSIQYGTSEKTNEDSSGISVMRMGNLQDGKLVFDRLKYLPKNWPLKSDFILEDGDVLFNRTNSAELVGKTAVYKTHHPPALFASYLIRVKINKNVYASDLLAFCINSVYGRKYIASVVSQQVGQANVNGTKLAAMPIPLPSLKEQSQIVSEIDRRFSILDSMEKTINQSLIEASRLRQSILKRAFEGELVPQDPNDEPASVLLEKIKNK